MDTITKDFVSRQEDMVLLSGSGAWSLYELTRPVVELGLEGGDRVYIEAATPEQGSVTVVYQSGKIRLERYDGQSSAFGVVYQAIGQDIH